MNGLATENSHQAEPADEWLTPGRFALLLGLLTVATFPGVLLGSTTFIIRDFGMFGYPLAYFHRQCFWRGELPLWNPLSNCGLPFLAQWNTLTLYPLSLIYLLLPLTWSLSFFCLAHMVWGGLGMYFLAHRWTGHRLAAALAGLIFSFNGLTLNALMWPNIIAALGWLPWVVCLGQRAWREGGKLVVWAALAGAMQMLAGGPEVILLTWVILFVFACGDWIRREGPRSRIPVRLFLLALLVAMICAAQLLPFLELLAHSQRDRGYSSASHDWSMPSWGWANFLVPLFRTTPTAQGVFFQNGQYWTSSYYAGIGTILFGAVAVRRLREWRVRALGGLLLLGLVLALGDGSLLYRSLRFCVPGIGFLRYPVKFVILVLAVAPLLAAFGVAVLASRIQRAGRFELAAALLMLLLIGAVVALDWKSPIPEDAWRATWQSGLSRAAFLVLILLGTAALLGSAGRRRVLLGCLVLLLFWLDFVTHAPAQNPGVKTSVYAPGWAREQLKLNPEPRLGGPRAMLSPAAREYLRYHPMAGLEETYLRNRLALRANCNLLDEVPQIDGFFSLTPREAYRVTALPYDQPNQSFRGLLDFLGVSQTTLGGNTLEWVPRPSAMPFVTAGQQPVFADDRTTFDALSQTNLDLRQLVFLPLEARGNVDATQQTSARVLDARFANQSISIHAEAPAASLVVISQSHYPAWRAYVDGRPATIWRANYAFQALEVSAGRHQIKMVYENKKLQAGEVLSGLGLLACANLWLGAHFRKRLLWAS
ncbi:MAG: YfhO family protein [Limisphaerales bacterium]